MIFRLIQLKKPSYRMLLVLLGLGALWFYYGGRAALRGLVFTPGIWGLGLLFPSGTRLRRVNRFAASLPIRGRDIYCAKMLEEIASGFLVVSVAAVPLVLSGRVPAGIAIAVSSEVGVLVALGRIAEYAYRPAEPATPKWWARAVGAFVFLAGTAISGQVPTTSHGNWSYVPLPATISLITLCVLGSVALLWSTWSSIPDALQLAPTDPVIEKRQGKEQWLPSFAWQPLLRALFSVGTLISCGILFLCGIFGLELFSMQGIAVVAFWFAIWAKLLALRARDSWVFALPLSRQRLFLAVAALPLGSLALGSILHFFDAPQSEASILYAFTVVVIVGLLPGFLIGVPPFARRWRLVWAYIRLTAILLMTCAIAWAIAVAPKSAAFLTGNSHLANSLAHSPWLSVELAALLGAAYWLASRGISRMEARLSRWTPARKDLY